MPFSPSHSFLFSILLSFLPLILVFDQSPCFCLGACLLLLLLLLALLSLQLLFVLLLFVLLLFLLSLIQTIPSHQSPGA